MLFRVFGVIIIFTSIFGTHRKDSTEKGQAVSEKD